MAGRMNLRLSSRLLALATWILAPVSVCAAQEPGETTVSESEETGDNKSLHDEIMKSVMGGKWWLQLRYRYENVDQDGISKQARASTLRTVLGYETAPLSGFSGLIEFEDVSVIGNDLYNDTLNGVTDRPVVADPDGTEINQSYLKFENDDWLAKLGRQRIVLGNHRFVGDVGWRQNEQTFDAFSVAVDAPGEIEGFYAYVHNVNRVFGDNSPMGDHAMDSHLLNVSRDLRRSERSLDTSTTSTTTR